MESRLTFVRANDRAQQQAYGNGTSFSHEIVGLLFADGL
jgi:hypothetical protein